MDFLPPSSESEPRGGQRVLGPGERDTDLVQIPLRPPLPILPEEDELRREGRDDYLLLQVSWEVVSFQSWPGGRGGGWHSD